jgi:hypothetical protein
VSPTPPPSQVHACYPYNSSYMLPFSLKKIWEETQGSHKPPRLSVRVFWRPSAARVTTSVAVTEGTIGSMLCSL